MMGACKWTYGKNGRVPRGGGGGEKVFDVTFDGQTTQYTFVTVNGTNYYSRGFGGIPEPTPNNMSADEFAQRAAKNGTVIKVSASELKKRKAQHAQYKATMDAFLNQAYANDPFFRKSDRRARIGNRAFNRTRRS